MPRLSASFKSTLFGMLLSILVVVPIANASSNPAIAFAEQIIGEISDLKQQTYAAGIPRWHLRHLGNRLRVSAYFVK